MLFKEPQHVPAGDATGPLLGEPIYPRTDGREGDASQLMLPGQFQALVIARGQKDILVVVAHAHLFIAMPHRADGVNDMLCRQVVARSHFRQPGGAAAERTTFCEQFRPCCAVNGAIHAATAQERFIGGVDDGIDLERGDIPADHADAAGDDVVHRHAGLRQREVGRVRGRGMGGINFRHLMVNLSHWGKQIFNA